MERWREDKFDVSSVSLGLKQTKKTDKNQKLYRVCVAKH